MKKSLLIAVAALFVALGANAQAKRVINATKVSAPMEKVQLEKASVTGIKDVIANHSKKANAPGKAASDLAGMYILELQNFDFTITTSSYFEIEAESGTTMVYNLETDEDNVEFEYNIKLIDFTWEGGVAYGFYHEDEGYIDIPVQTIGTNATYGRIVLSGVTCDSDGPAHVGFDMILDVDADGSISLYDLSQELEDAGYTGEYMSGWYSFLPDDADGGVWNYGFEIEFFAPNATMKDYERHVASGGWQDWAWTEYPVYVEDFGTDVVVHNFFGLAPVSIARDGDTAIISFSEDDPIIMYDYNYGDADNPDYMHIWTLSEDGEGLIENGSITGTFIGEGDNLEEIAFYELEYRDENYDGSGTYDAGYYYVFDYTKWFMVSTTYGDQGAYWMGEYMWVGITMDGATTGVVAPKVTPENPNAKIYDLQGRAVDSNYKGVVIKNGKKFVVK